MAVILDFNLRPYFVEVKINGRWIASKNKMLMLDGEFDNNAKSILSKVGVERSKDISWVDFVNNGFVAFNDNGEQVVRGTKQIK